jgi:hypothetical protein
LESSSPQLWQAGITDIFVNGSFVTSKDHPNDIDGYFLCSFWDVASGALEQRLNSIAPGMWPLDFARWIDDPHKGLKPPTWFAYSVEFYWDYVDRPAFVPPMLMRGGKTVGQFFRESRQDRPRGIVRIVQREGASSDSDR